MRREQAMLVQLTCYAHPVSCDGGRLPKSFGMLPLYSGGLGIAMRQVSSLAELFSEDADLLSMEVPHLESVVKACPDERLRWSGWIALLSLVVHKQRNGSNVSYSRDNLIAWLGEPVKAMDGEDEGLTHLFFAGPTGSHLVMVDFRAGRFVGFGTMLPSEMP